jgi:phosphohistidine phosphatase
LRVEFRLDERIDWASARGFLEVMSEIEHAANIVILIGHNPGFEVLFEALTSEAANLPTASLACTELGVKKWNQVRGGVGHMIWMLAPKELWRD